MPIGAQSVQGPIAQVKQNVKMPSTGESPSGPSVGANDQITLSKDALATLSEATVAKASGKSSESPAHQARAMMGEGLLAQGYKNFGQLVSAIARGHFAAQTEETTSTEVSDPEVLAALPVDEISGDAPPLQDPLVAETLPLPPADEIFQDVVPNDEATTADTFALPSIDEVVREVILPEAAEPTNELLDLLEEERSEPA